MSHQSRSSINLETLQESLDAGQLDNAQYETPGSLASELYRLLGLPSVSTVFDPQSASGALVRCVQGYPIKFGIELDPSKTPGDVHVITGNCIKIFEAVEELKPDLKFMVANANPPFGRRWKTSDGNVIDSTLATWNFVTRHGRMGFFIANANTIEKFGIHESTDKIRITHYSRRKASLYWSGLRDTLEIGCVCWKEIAANQPTSPGDALTFWKRLASIIDEESISRPEWNVWLDARGFLRTYLSQRTQYKKQLTPDQVKKLIGINNCHPLTLTTERETRKLLKELVEGGIYTIEPKAEHAIKQALLEVDSVAAPIMPVSDFEHVAYTDEEEHLLCHTSVDADIGNGVHLKLTAGKSYELTTGSYKFTEAFQRDKVHYDEEAEKTYTAKHHCTLSGQDRFIRIIDDTGMPKRFMDRPAKDSKNDIPEARLWEWFSKPKVDTVADVNPEHVNTNHAVLKACEMMAGYTYYEGQLTYLSRVAVKDSALIAGQTGCGKSLMAISLLAMKSPKRALIIAPQGTMRASKVDEDDEDEDAVEEMSASQWVKELARFAPYLQIFEIFSYDDYVRIKALNNGQLPHGVYLTYYEAFFTNGAMERTPEGWNDERLMEHMATKYGFKPLDEENDSLGQVNKKHWCDTIGKEVEGVRCVIEPCMASRIGHEFDFVTADEAHRCKGMKTLATNMLIRLQPKFRYALTATPIANVVTDLFPLMGWLAVPDWYKGNRRNAAWPYAREDANRFASTFLTMERDHTQEDENARKNPKNKSKCIKESPVISSPARLLKLVKPMLAFISKEQCNEKYIKPKTTDVRVPMGQMQARLYGWYTNRGNIPASNALVRARKQGAWLRSICADPVGFRHGNRPDLRPKSNMNPKVIAILELTREILARGEQVVIINSRVGLTSAIVERLAEAGVPMARIDSTISAEQHAYQANLFKSGKARVLCMGIKLAAAYSFDACDNLIVGSLEYTWGTWAQAVGRIDRVTNKKVKSIYCILCKNSIEEVMYEVAVGLKGDAANLVLRGKRMPREFRPVDAAEVLAKALDRFSLDGTEPETSSEAKWPKLCGEIKKAVNK